MASGTLAKPSYKVVAYTASYTANASSGVTISADDFVASTPTGYAPVAVTKFTSGTADVVVRYADATSTGSSVTLAMRNVATSAKSATAGITILYVRM